VDEAFFLPQGDDRWLATVHTTGPWDVRFQHGGPPAALLGRAIERCEPRDDLLVARTAVEILGPVPVGEVSVRARMLRPGRSVELVEAVLSADGRDAVRAAAWRIRRTDAGDVPPPQPSPPAIPAAAFAMPDAGWVDGYLSAVEWRFAAGRFDQPGPATVWSRLRHPLVPDEELSPLQRVLAVADSGNGLSSELDLRTWHFINPELTVHLHREARGEWVCVDARTTISTGGAGLATTVLSDADGPVGVGAQSLLVAPR
jgi:hypothetical protein